jgi:2-polyprenyl-3-methyl-5-hydroxy-6-metoxy-1,4-benzoquinol methylase
MTGLLDAVRAGYYARNQLQSRSRLISWSHQARFRTALRIARQMTGGRQLDYGCGDGTFLGLLASEREIVAVGAEIHSSIVDDCRARFAGHDNLRFVLVSELDRGAAESYDVIYCMEVFEHVTDARALLERFDRLLAPGGTLIISVPIETGFPVVVKQIVRAVAGWRGIGNYPGTTGYTLGEMVMSVLAGSTQHIERPVFRRDDGGEFHDHKGFNWRVLKALVRDRFHLVREDTSPVGWLGPHLGTQRWFLARKRIA